MTLWINDLLEISKKLDYMILLTIWNTQIILIIYLLWNFLYNNIHFQLYMSKPSDEQLRQAIDAIFNKYDTDHSGTL